MTRPSSLPSLSVDPKDRLRRLETIATVLDSGIPIGPYKIGVEALIGLIPGIGDALGVGLSSFIILESAKLGASRLTLARMFLNCSIDFVLGLVPVLGDLFDFAFKANQKNLKLLKATTLRPGSEPKLGSSIAFALFGIFIFGVIAISLAISSIIMLVKWIV